MLTGSPLRAALETAPLVSFDGSVTRFLWERYRYKAMPDGALQRGGRYNEPGTRAIYTSFSRTCAFLEFTDDRSDEEPLSAASMLSLYVRLRRVLDLTNDDVAALLQTSRDELCQPLFRKTGQPTQQLGTVAASLRIDGIIAPSRVSDKKNLVIFPDTHTLPPYHVIARVGAA